MKKMYESPIAEKIEFRYADQVVASNGGEPEPEPTYYPGDFLSCGGDGAMDSPKEMVPGACLTA